MMKVSAIKALWAEHTRCEFVLKDASAVMETMTKHPYVNHLPTMRGGEGYEGVYQFYKHHFIPTLPQEYEITSISCTVDQERLIDEQVLRFKHDSVVDFILPNIPPTGKEITVALVVIVYVQDQKIAREHIYWDQATVLKQIDYIHNSTWPVSGSEQANELLKYAASIPINDEN
ncbi:MAG TPA: hypothetical protein VHD33_08490 [Legionellaceae bacterium]|nr:hypothetical protein [Legionellaceae bacterium]